jgi:hypothetical protein
MQNPIIDIENTLAAIQNNYLIGSTDFETLTQDLRLLSKQVRQCEGGTPRGTAKQVYEALNTLGKDGVAAAYWWHRFETRRVEFGKLKNQALLQIQIYLNYCQEEIEMGATMPATWRIAA